MADLGNIVYISHEDLERLRTYGEIEINNIHYTYNEDDVYCTPYDEFSGVVASVNGKVGKVVITADDLLTSGENIKTINGTSLLGPGNIEISGSRTLVEADVNILFNTSSNPPKLLIYTGDGMLINTLANNTSKVTQNFTNVKFPLRIDGITADNNSLNIAVTKNGFLGASYVIGDTILKDVGASGESVPAASMFSVLVYPDEDIVGNDGHNPDEKSITINFSN